MVLKCALIYRVDISSPAFYTLLTYTHTQTPSIYTDGCFRSARRKRSASAVVGLSAAGAAVPSISTLL